MEDDIEAIDNEISDLDDKISELRSAKEPTAEQKQELVTLQSDRKSRLTKRTTALLGRTKAAEERARKAEEKTRELEDKFNAAEKRLPAQPKNHQKVTFDGEEFFTDASLRSMVESGEMPESEAWDHQEQRRVAAAAERLAKKGEAKSFETRRNNTITEVLKEYPKLNPKHAQYDLNDPFTAEVDRLLRNGYMNNPEGLREAVKDAKKILRISDKKPDLSDEFGVTRSDSNGEPNQRTEKKVELTDWEGENAVRMWVNTGMINPKTGKTYTKPEALEKALLAKKNRAQELATR